MEHTNASPMVTDVSTPHAEMTIDASQASTDHADPAIRLIRRLVIVNLGLITLQPLSAGFLMSGYDYASTVHAVVAQALLLVALILAVTAVILWRRRRVPAWVAGVGISLVVTVFLEIGFGHNRSYWLHVPVGVGLFGWLTRLTIRLDAMRRATGARS